MHRLWSASVDQLKVKPHLIFLTWYLPPQHILIVQRQLSVLDEELEEFRAALRQYMDCACAQTGCLQSVQGCCCVVLLCCLRQISHVKGKLPLIVGVSLFYPI